MRHVWTAELLAELDAKYKAGASIAQLAQDYGLTYSSIRSVLVRHGLRPAIVPNRYHVWDEAEEDQLIIDFEAGLPMSSIRKRYSFNNNMSCYNRIHRIETARGIKIKRGRTIGL